jgi:hypothetical protein
MLRAETLSSVSFSTVVKILSPSVISNYFAVSPKEYVFSYYLRKTRQIFSGSNQGFVLSEAEIYLISKAPRPASQNTHCLIRQITGLFFSK